MPIVQFLLFILSLLLGTVSSLTCSSPHFGEAYPNCLPLPTLNSFLHFSLNPQNSTISVVFLAAPPTPGGWIAWGLNPTGRQMVGAQVVAAYKTNDGMVVKSFNIKSKNLLIPGKLTIDIWDMKAKEAARGYMIIYATMKIPDNVDYLNHTWQVGSAVSRDGMILEHASDDANLNSTGVIDLTKAKGSCVPHAGRKYGHGIISALSWCVLQLIEVFIEKCRNKIPLPNRRLIRLHTSCQIINYLIGFVAFGLGVMLESESGLIQFTMHRNIGIAIYCMATIKLICSLFIMPNVDQRYTFGWKMCSYSLGYGIVALGVINLYNGIRILDHGKTLESFSDLASLLLFLIVFIFEVVIRL